MTKPLYLTPPAIGRELQVKPARVIGWIRNGELPAVNVGDGSLRPRWRVSRVDLETFLRRRLAQAPMQTAGRRRKSTQVIEFF